MPAVLILELVADAARNAIGSLRISRVRSAKFLAPLAPMQTMDIHLEWDATAIRFRCAQAGQPIAQGVIEYAGSQ